MGFWHNYLSIGIIIAIVETIFLTVAIIFKTQKFEEKGFGQYLVLYLRNFAVTIWMWPLVLLGIYKG